MQLFLVPYLLQKNKLVVSDKDFLHQLCNVLRAKKGYVCYIQDIAKKDVITVSKKNIFRYKCSLDQASDQNAIFSILEKVEFSGLAEEGHHQTMTQTTVCIALPNKIDKIELIVQKLTEIGMYEIIFWKARRSILQNISSQKIERLEKIAREAVEQSRGRFIPTIRIINDLYILLEQILQQNDYRLIVFDKSNEKNHIQTQKESIHLNDTLQATKSGKLEKSFYNTTYERKEIDEKERILDITSLTRQDTFFLKEIYKTNHVIGIIGPEGGFDEYEYQIFRKYKNHLTKVSLGNTILRMETAAIVGGWLLLHWKDIFSLHFVNVQN